METGEGAKEQKSSSVVQRMRSGIESKLQAWVDSVDVKGEWEKALKHLSRLQKNGQSMSAEKQARNEQIFKLAVAINKYGALTGDIVASVVAGVGVGIAGGNIGKEKYNELQTFKETVVAAPERGQSNIVNFGKNYDRKAKLTFAGIAAGTGAGALGLGTSIFVLRPFSRASVLLARTLGTVSEKVAGITDAIALRREAKRV